MSSAPIPAPFDDPVNPTSVPLGADSATPLDESEAKTKRRAHSRDESYVKAVGRMNYLYALLFAVQAAWSIHFAYLHLSGAISADWSVQPRWLTFHVILCLTVILALVAGYGFRRLERWALGAEALFSVCALFVWAILVFASRKPSSFAAFALEFAGGIALMVALFAPLLNLWDVRKSTVFTTEYRRMIVATPSIRIRGRLPWELKIPAILFFVIFVILSIVNEVRTKGQ
jgi:hypothetical protein